MSRPLDHWQDRLERHFRSLATLRNSVGLPLFALEHGLSQDELTEVRTLIIEQASTAKPLPKYWLPWIIYATEIGYSYAGEEYWQSFSEQTPGWDSDYRAILKNWFIEFETTYHGYKPSGPWAEQFTIISHPITHAILPKYLQKQFASVLYQLQYELARLSDLDSASVERLLTCYQYNRSTRFDTFLQQKELAGRIAIGLLDPDQSDKRTPIQQDVLRRIISDLDQGRKAGGLLKEAKRTIDRFKGIGHGVGPSLKQAKFDSLEQPTNHPIQINMCPEIFLRYSGSNKWAVVMEVPNLSSLATINQDLMAFVKDSRCQLAGSTDKKPAGWTISGSRLGVVKSWPNNNEPLIKFEQQNTDIERLIQENCRMPVGPIWLFRINTDGLARRVKGLNVYPNAKYILASANDLSTSTNSFIGTCELDCQGIHATHITVPENISSDQMESLKSLGLEVARTIYIWPAGIPCRKWDGEGQSEWLTTESPRFGMMHDHPVESYSAELNREVQTTVIPNGPGQPVFIELSPLPVGQYVLRVNAHRISKSDNNDDIIEGYIELNVREPRPWVPRMSAHTGFIATLDPYDADLDEFWKNDVNLSVHGPEGYNLKCMLTLYDGRGNELLHIQVGGAMKFPITPSKWHKQFNQFLKKHQHIYSKYLEASSCALELQGDELGHYNIEFYRTIRPIRWVAREQNTDIMLRLVDDMDVGPSEIICQEFSMNHPTRSKTYDASDMLGGIIPEPPGGLFITKHDHHEDAIIISSLSDNQDFHALGINPDFSDIANGGIPIDIALSILARWKSARHIGIIPEYRLSKVTNGLLHALYEKLCGQNWAKVETAFIEDPKSQQGRDNLQERIGENSAFTEALRMNFTILQSYPDEITKWYTDALRRHNISDDSRLCRFALHLACEAHTLTEAYRDDDLRVIIHKARSDPQVLRGARYMALLYDTSDQGSSNSMHRRQRWH